MKLQMKKFHPFHMVMESPWPLLASLSALSLTMSMVMMMSFSKISWIALNTALLLTIYSALQWWRDVNRESEQGFHTLTAIKGLKWGMILFISSEVLFFSAFLTPFIFASYYDISIESMISYPMKGINPMDPMSIPLLNTAVLLSSGGAITASHKYWMEKENTKSIVWIVITILLGAFFTYLQAMEYSQAEFSMSDSFYGSLFFMTTGFHGLHVIIGSLFLACNAANMMIKKMSEIQSSGMEMAIWYWHFVDVVWLFLYLFFYWQPIQLMM